MHVVHIDNIFLLVNSHLCLQVNKGKVRMKDIQKKGSHSKFYISGVQIVSSFC
jgi:hypothetical protein